MIIRAYQLKLGDTFRKQSVVHVVARIEGKMLMCRHKSNGATGSRVSGSGGAEISMFSQERVELIINLSNTNK